MKFSRTEHDRRVWVALQTKELVKAFGGQECTSAFLGCSVPTIKKWRDVYEPGNITLMNLVKLEEEMVSIGLDPEFTLAHLRALGYTASKLEVTTSKAPATCALDMVQAACDAIKAASEAAADLEITPAEHKLIVEMFETTQREYAKYQTAYRASISEDAEDE